MIQSRPGTYSVPVDHKPYGLVQWEVTIAELLSGQGYATAHYGKWHLGDSQDRYHNDQAFDEWYAIPNSSDQSLRVQQKDLDPTRAHLEYPVEGRKGESSRKLKGYGGVERREIDTELANRTNDFIKRNIKGGKSLFSSVPNTRCHFQTEVSKKCTGRSGRGLFADKLAEMDENAGRPLCRVGTQNHRQHRRDLNERQRPRGRDAMARLGRPLVGHLCHGNGRVPPRGLYYPLLQQGACGSRQR